MGTVAAQLCNQARSSPDPVRVVDAAQVQILFAAIFGTRRPGSASSPHVLIPPVALDQRRLAVLPTAVAFGAGEPNHVGRMLGQRDLGAGHLPPPIESFVHRARAARLDSLTPVAH
jgi:hypothetical protein